jgi:hypothetical protein
MREGKSRVDLFVRVAIVFSRTHDARETHGRMIPGPSFVIAASRRRR